MVSGHKPELLGFCGFTGVYWILLCFPRTDGCLPALFGTRKRQQPLTSGPAHLPSPAHPSPSRNFRPVLPGPSLPPIIRGMHISFRELDPRTTNTNTSTPELISFISLVDPHSSTKYPNCAGRHVSVRAVKMLDHTRTRKTACRPLKRISALNMSTRYDSRTGPI